MAMEQAEYPRANLDDLPALRTFIREAGERLGAAPDPLAEMIVAANEALTNILSHGYEDQPGRLLIKVAVIGNRLEVRLRDQAPAFDPTTLPPPNPALPLERRAIGGMGVQMMRAFSDELRYERHDSGENVLTLVKHEAC